MPIILRVAMLALIVSCAGPGAPRGAILHTVYFELRDPKHAPGLVASCSRRLDVIPGILEIHAGAREESQQRQANDLVFHVGLSILFEDVDALEAYLAHPAHLALVEDFMPRIAALRVFDYHIEG